MGRVLVDVEVAYSADHSISPIRVTSSGQLVAVVDDVLSRQERLYNYIFISVSNSLGEFVARLGVGVLLDGSGGFINYNDGTGNYLTRGESDSDSPVEFFGWAYAVHCPESSIVELSSVKSALADGYDLGFGNKPDVIDWQNWFDCSPSEGDANYWEGSSDADLEGW